MFAVFKDSDFIVLSARTVARGPMRLEWRSESEDWRWTACAMRGRRRCAVTRDGVICHALFGNSPKCLFGCNGPDISLSSSTNTMPIAPITGKLRKRFWLDVGCAMGLGVSAGYAYWCVLRVSTAFILLTRSAGMVFTSSLVCGTWYPCVLFS